MEREYNVGTWLTPSDEYIKDIKDALVEKGIVEENTPDSELSKVIQQADLTDYMELRITGQPHGYSNSNITELEERAFQYDLKLHSIDLPNVVTIKSNAFSGVGGLKNVNLPNVETLYDHAFYNSFMINSVELLCLPKLKTFKGQTGNTFAGNQNPSDSSIGLLNISLPKLEKIGYYDFKNCGALKSIYLGSCVSVGGGVFDACARLVAVIITQTNSVTTLSSTSAFSYCYHILGTTHSSINPNGAKDGYIYVPDSLVDSYKVATNWSTYATQIKGLSELSQEYKDLYGI